MEMIALWSDAQILVLALVTSLAFATYVSPLAGILAARAVLALCTVVGLAVTYYGMRAHKLEKFQSGLEIVVLSVLGFGLSVVCECLLLAA